MPGLLERVRELELQELIAQLNAANKAFEELSIELAHERRLRMELEVKLKDAIKMAIFDPLTGASTRREMEQQISLHFASLKRAKKLVEEGAAQTSEIEEFSILFLDLNGLKMVNDSFGHKAGDTLIRTFGEVLRMHFKRETDIVCRWGGDEFVVLLGGVTPRVKAEALAVEFLHELSDISLKFSFGKSNGGMPHEIPIRASVGVSSTSDGFHTMEELIAAADNEMYRHKNETKQSRE